jgi:hypothetical protein
MSKVTGALPWIFSILALVSGCDEVSTPVARAPEPGGANLELIRSQLTQKQRFRSIDDEFAYLVGVIPGGFGGWYYDREGRPNVWLVEHTQKEAAIAALIPILKNRFVDLGGRAMDLDNIQILQGQYDFRTLKQWRERIDQVAFSSIRGLVSTDVHEGKNRILLGVEDAGDVGVIRQIEVMLSGLNIPGEAVVIERRARGNLAKLLTDYTRLVHGGYEIRHRDEVQGHLFGCTMSFNAKLATTLGFVTAAHCSNTWDGWDGEVYYQLAENSTYKIGEETRDPGFSTGGLCPSGFVCRWADALFATWTAPDRADFRFIARTTKRDSLRGSITVASTPFEIAAEDPYPDMGEEMDKLGISTGWTYGQVFDTCVNINWDNYRMFLCQDRFSTGLQLGDSGGPVFTALTQYDVVLRGLVWSGADGFVNMSNMSNIELDVGSIETR